MRAISLYRRLLYTVGLAIALITAARYFFNLITLMVCAILVLFARETHWRIHAAVVAFTSGLAALIGLRFATSPPLGIITGIVFGTLSAYAGLWLGIWRLQKRSGGLPPGLSRANARLRSLHVNPKTLNIALVVLGVLTPLGFWSSVNLNLDVAFNEKPMLLWVNAPTTPAIGTPFRITVQAWDRFERLSAAYQGSVTFALESYDPDSLSLLAPETVVAQLPPTYTFTGRPPHTITDSAYTIQDGKDNGSRSFEITVFTPGIHYLVVREVASSSTDSDTRLPFDDARFYSNPIVITPPTTANSNIYWGDLHTHSSYSDGSGSPAHNAFFARHVAQLDFYALTDHTEIMFFSPWRYGALERLTNAINDPGEFVALQAIEWTNVKYGHYTLLLSGDALPRPADLLPGRFGPFSSPARLWQDLDIFTSATGTQALAVPHHTTKVYYPQDWTYLNPNYVRLAEISSTHGDSLYEQRHPLNYAGGTGIPKTPISGLSITDALLMGHHLSLISGSDGHDGHPGHSLSHTEAAIGHQRPWSNWPTRTTKPYPGGLTAVLAGNLDREAIFDALLRGRVYANSDHGRPLLRFSVNGVTVGDGATVTVPSPTTPRTLHITIAQDGAPAASRDTSAADLVHEGWRPDWNATVEILKNGLRCHTFDISTPVAELTYVDTEPVLGAEYALAIEQDGSTYLNAMSDNPVNPDTLNTRGADFYIVRVVGANGRITTMGAIWVQAPGKLP